LNLFFAWRDCVITVPSINKCAEHITEYCSHLVTNLLCWQFLPNHFSSSNPWENEKKMVPFSVCEFKVHVVRAVKRTLFDGRCNKPFRDNCGPIYLCMRTSASGQQHFSNTKWLFISAQIDTTVLLQRTEPFFFHFLKD
jgi:hypothetical protein